MQWGIAGQYELCAVRRIAFVDGVEGVKRKVSELKAFFDTHSSLPQSLAFIHSSLFRWCLSLCVCLVGILSIHVTLSTAACSKLGQEHLHKCATSRCHETNMSHLKHIECISQRRSWLLSLPSDLVSRCHWALGGLAWRLHSSSQPRLCCLDHRHAGQNSSSYDVIPLLCFVSRCNSAS